MTHIACFGTSHRTAPTEFREHLLREASALAKELQGPSPQTPRTGVAEVIALFTCNRAELYVAWEEDRDQTVGDLILERARLSPQDINERCYEHNGMHAVRHLCRVSSGLDSMVLGESEVAGQVTRAFRSAGGQGGVGDVLSAAFQTAIRAGRRARAETAIGKGSASVSSIAVLVASQMLGGFDDRNIVLAGTGKMGRLASEAFRTLGGAALTMANRTPEHALELSQRLGARVVSLDQLGEHIVDADLLLTTTSAPGYILDVDTVRAALRCRTNAQPLVILDIAVPRDVDPAVGQLPGVSLIGLDDLQQRIEANLAQRRSEIPRVERIIEEEMDAFERRLHERRVEPLIRELRQRAEAIRERELRKAVRGAGNSAAEALDRFSRSLVDKLLHEPTRRLKAPDPLPSGDHERVVRELFALDPQSDHRPDRMVRHAPGNDSTA